MTNYDRMNRWALTRGLSDLSQGAKQEAWEARFVAAVAGIGLVLLAVGIVAFA